MLIIATRFGYSVSSQGIRRSYHLGRLAFPQRESCGACTCCMLLVGYEFTHDFVT